MDESQQLVDQILGLSRGGDLLQKLLLDDGSSDSDDDAESTELDGPGRRGQAERGPRKVRYPYKSRFWSYVLMAERDRENGDGMWDEESYEGAMFRRRFRLPYYLFQQLVDEYSTVDPRTDFDAAGKPKIDTRLLVMGALRALGQALPFDTIEELTDVASPTLNAFFKTFCSWMSGRPFKREVHLPRNAEQLLHVSEFYRILGLPGCARSADCVHIPWDKCPAGLLTNCKGKEGYPTLAFQIITSHTRKILAASKAFYGTWNDKSITTNDENMVNFRDDPLFAKQRWEYMKEDGTVGIQEGVYLIVDGGYQRWKHLICPFKLQPEGSEELFWSDLVESMRKDVECTFGILKKRFTFLKHSVQLHDMDSISEAFRAACVLHNILLDWDGKDKWEEWMLDDDGQGYDAFLMNETNIHNDDTIFESISSGGNGSFMRGNHMQNMRMAQALLEDEEVDTVDFHERREALISHYKTVYNSLH